MLSDGETYKMETISPSPTKRTNHSGVIYKTSLFIFGGWDGTKTLNDMYELSINTMIWYQIIYQSELSPFPTYRHCSCIVGDYLIIFGGIDFECQKHNELFSYAIPTKQWKLLVPQGTPPPPRTFHAMTYSSNTLRILGGFGKDNKFLNDAYELSLNVSQYTFSENKPNIPQLYSINENVNKEESEVEFMRKQIKELLSKYNEELWKNICKLCFDKKTNTVIMPCGHRFACSECAVKLSKCSECNGKIDYVIKTFS